MVPLVVVIVAQRSEEMATFASVTTAANQQISTLL